jgi:hypothetical protein
MLCTGRRSLVAHAKRSHLNLARLERVLVRKLKICCDVLNGELALGKCYHKRRSWLRYTRILLARAAGVACIWPRHAVAQISRDRSQLFLVSDSGPGTERDEASAHH